MSAKELSCFHNSKRGETTNKNWADIWCLVFSHWLVQRKSQKLFFIKLDSSNLVEYIADPDRYLLISSSECLNKTFFLQYSLFFSLSKKSSNCSTTHSNILSLLLDSTFDPPSWLACWKKNAKIYFLSKSGSIIDYEMKSELSL